MHRAAGQPVQERAIDGAEAELAVLRALPCPLHVLEQPAQLGPAEIRVEDEARLLPDPRLFPLCFQFVTEIRGPPVLPHDGVVNRLAGLPFPEESRLALVGDADAMDVFPFRSGLAHRPSDRLERRAPDVVKVVLDPARLGEDLPELDAGRSLHRQALIEDQRSGAGGALIDREDVPSHVGPR